MVPSFRQSAVHGTIILIKIVPVHRLTRPVFSGVLTALTADVHAVVRLLFIPAYAYRRLYDLFWLVLAFLAHTRSMLKRLPLISRSSSLFSISLNRQSLQLIRISSRQAVAFSQKKCHYRFTLPVGRSRGGISVSAIWGGYSRRSTCMSCGFLSIWYGDFVHGETFFKDV